MRKLTKSISGKIYTGFILVIIILLLVALWSINNFSQLSSAINNIMEENYRSIQSSENMIEAIERQDSSILLVLSGQETEGLTAFRNYEQEFLKWFSRAEDNITISGESQIITELNERYTEFLVKFDEFRELELEERQQFYNEVYSEQFFETKEKIRELRSINQDEMISAQQAADFRAGRAMLSTALISIAGIIIAILSGFYLTKRILAPVEQLQSGIQKVAAKNFKEKLPVNSEDEIGELTEEFNKMIDKLQEYENVNVRKLLVEKEKSEAIVNHISSPLLVTDAENNLILFNQESKDLFDLKDEDLNKHFLEVINNQELFACITGEIECEKNEAGTPVLELEKNNSKNYYKILNKRVYKEIKSDNNKLKFSVTLLEDITRLKEIDQLKSDFISTVSHEFRTPLTSITMALNMLVAEDLGDINSDQEELLQNSLDDCDRLTSLVEDLLDLSKMESGKIELDIRSVKLKKLTQNTIKHFADQAEEKSINLYIDDISEDLTVDVDPNKISWVISNLVGNALRYTGEGDQIKISASQRGNLVYVEVYDTGKGIKKSDLSRIFEKFYRSESNESKTGSGLGLTIAKEIITAHNGRIWVDSEKGSWTKFTFSLPVAKNNNPEIEEIKDE
ncbi:HAMP domain-containing protein [Halanaerobiaceae bacterium Z-7014]|uniref:histidine kinase n=1 Tax=Halonatronomonas betaini TaxID=2778430 RepID=A0A931AZ37_9FIRM|nr:ATP-binding protein [Halonatronomonas betaini]MBF8437438.1 HAMP domain-containing protein [Halonatronomonas betaini]